DEFFFLALPVRGSYQAAAEVIRDRMLEEVGVPVTVGIARSKTLAKLISDTAKPLGALAVMGRDAEAALLAHMPVAKSCGIGDRRAARLAPYGIVTCMDLALADRLLIRKLLTVTGEAIWYEVNGEAVVPILSNRPPHKSVARGGSIGEATADPHKVWAWVVRSLERLIEELEYHGVRAGHLTVAVVYKNGPSLAGEVPLPVPQDRFDLLLEAARQGLRKAWLPGPRVSHL